MALSVATALLCGCAATGKSGLDYASMSQKIGPPKAGHARIVVLREQLRAGLVDQGWDVKLDGAPLTGLKAGTYVYIDRPAGGHQLSATETLFPGTTQHEISAQSGRTYFFLAQRSKKSDAITAATVIGGLAGAAVGAAMTSGEENPGPLDFVPLDEATARTRIAELQLGS